MRFSPGNRPILFVAVVALTMIYPRCVRADQTYLALGDSLAFGVGANDMNSDVSNGDRGYVGAFADALAARRGGVRPHVVDLGISGETSTSFFQIGAGLNGPDAALRNTNYGIPLVSQDSLLMSTIANLPQGDTVSNVTIQLGANDLYQTVGTPGFFDLSHDEQEALFRQTLGAIQANDATLLTELRTALPEAQLILMGYYDPYAPFLNDPKSPFFAIAQASHEAIPALNQLIEGVAASFGAIYVDTYTPLVGNELAYTYIASGNSHPNALGYAAIAGQLIAVPEPTSLTLLGLGAAGLVGVTRKRPKAENA